MARRKGLPRPRRPAPGESLKVHLRSRMSSFKKRIKDICRLLREGGDRANFKRVGCVGNCHGEARTQKARKAICHRVAVNAAQLDLRAAPRGAVVRKQSALQQLVVKAVSAARKKRA